MPSVLLVRSVFFAAAALFSLACGGGGGSASSSSSVAISPNVTNTKPLYVRVGVSSANLRSEGSLVIASAAALAKPQNGKHLKSSREKSYPIAVQLYKFNGQTLSLSRIQDNLYQGSHDMATGEIYLLKAQVGSEIQKGYYAVTPDPTSSKAVTVNPASTTRAKTLEGHFRGKAVEGDAAVLAGVNTDPTLLDQAVNDTLVTVPEGGIKVLMRGQGDLNFSPIENGKIAVAPMTSFISTERYWLEENLTFTGFGTLKLTFPKSTGNLLSLQVYQDGRSLLSGTYLNASGEQVNTFFANESKSYEVQVDFMAPTVITGTSGVSLLNELRAKAGMTSLSVNVMLEQSADSHAKYLVAVRPTNNVADSYHTESVLQGNYYTGMTPTDRAAFRGYAYPVTENVASGDNVQESIELLFSAIYHRFKFLDFSIADVGVARANELPLGGSAVLSQVDVFNMGAGATASTSGNGNPALVVWPADGAEGIPPAFNEAIPDPLPDLSVSGYPISVQFSDLDVSGNGVDVSGNVIVTSLPATIMANVQLKLTSGNTNIPLRAIDSLTDPNSIFTAHQFAWFPLERLEYGTTYSANLSYDEAGVAQLKAWSFTTKNLEMPILEILASQRSHELISGKDYALYFAPSRSGVSTITSLSFVAVNGAEAQVESLDGNTVLVCLHGDLGSGITFTVNGSESWSLVLSETDAFASQVSAAGNVTP